MNKILFHISDLIGKKIIFPFYHLVSDEECPHIRHLYPVKTIQKFEEELDFFQRNYQPIDLKEILQHLQNNTAPKKPSFFLSFDDGLKECHSVIAPILKKRNLSAAFFINTGFVDNQALFFRYKISLLIDHLEKSNVNFSKQDWLEMTYADTEKIDLLAKDLHVDFNQFLKEQQPYMNWSEIEDLKNQGFHIGAHSIDHPLYANISLEEQIRQTQESMEEIQSRLILNSRIFSFPFTDDGVSTEFFKEIFEQKIVDLSFGTAGIKDDEFQNNLQRLPMDNCLNSVESFVFKNQMMYVLKKIIGKHQVQH